MTPLDLPKPVLDDLRFRRGENRIMTIEIACAILPILRKHRPRFKSFDVFAGTISSILRACTEDCRKP